MATSLCSAVVLAALLQAPGGPPAAAGPLPDSAAGSSLPALRARLARDSSDGGAWLLLGRLYLQLADDARSEEHTSELQSRPHLVCRLLLEKKKIAICITKATLCGSE